MSGNDQDDLHDNPWVEKDSTPKKPETKPEEKKPKEPFPFNKARLSAGRDKGDKGRQNPFQGQGNPLDDLIDKIGSMFAKKGGDGGGGPKSFPRAGFLLIGLVLLGGWLSTGLYRVQEGEVAVILRFGEMVRVAAPGLRYRLPQPIETEIIKKVAVLNKIDGGVRSDSSKASNEAMEQTLILTGDENMVHTNYTVLWKIKDVADFLFTAREPESTIRVAAESAIREILGQTTARLALTEGRGVIGTQSQELLQKILDNYKMGVQIVSVQLQRVEPPSQVIQAFNDMQASLVDGDRLRNEAEAYHNDILPRARGEAEKILQDAEAYKQQVVAQAEGEAGRFNAVYTSYKLNPDVTVRRYYLETMQQVLGRAQKTIVSAEVSKGIMPYLNLQNSNSKKNPSPEKADNQ